MKKKSVAALVLGVVLTGAILTGCGKSPNPGQDALQESSPSALQEAQQEIKEETQEGAQQKTEDETEEGVQQETAIGEGEASENGNQTAAEYEDNFAVDSEAAKEFAVKVKEAAANKDLEALADLTSFPVYVGLPDVSVVETREDFLKLGADTVFTEELLESVENADIENFQPSMAGFSISDGGTANINFGVADGTLAINGINY